MSTKSVRKAIGVKPEGFRDTGFMNYLYSLYHVPNRRLVIKNGHGGTPLAQLESISKEYRFKACEEIHLLYDTDIEKDHPGIIQKVEAKAKKMGYQAHQSKECIDYKLVEMLNPSKKDLKLARQSTDGAKKVLRKLCGLKREDGPIDWNKKFPKKLLDAQMPNNPWLRELKKIVTGQ